MWLVRQAFAWCLIFFAFQAVSWLVWPTVSEPLGAASSKMIPAAALMTIVGGVGWLLLQRHPDLLGWLLTALLAAYIVVAAVAIGMPELPPIMTFAHVVLDYAIPVFLGIAAISAARVLGRAQREQGVQRRGVRPLQRPVSLDEFEVSGPPRKRKR